MNKPLYPADGMEYDLAMMEAEKEYNAWVASRKKNVKGNGITIFAKRKHNETETD